MTDSLNTLLPLVGVVIGILLNHVTSMRSERQKWRLNQQEKEIDSRTKLYEGLLSGAHRVVLSNTKDEYRKELRELLVGFAHIRFRCRDEVVSAARNLVQVASMLGEPLIGDENPAFKADHGDLANAINRMTDACGRELSDMRKPRT